MVQVRKTIGFFILTFLCYATVAQEYSTTPESSKDSVAIDYEQYLSESAKKEIAIKITQSRIVERINNGTLFDNEGVEGEVGSITIPVSFTREADYSDGLRLGEQTTSSNGYSAGNIECWDLQAQTPHRGERLPSLPKVPKAKAEGKCKYVHGVGTPPPWVDFELRQMLLQYRISQDPILGDDTLRLVGESVEFHRERGLEVQWFTNGPNYTGTQVFGRCPLSGHTDLYVHDFQIYVIPAPGWYYHGPRPFMTAPTVRSNLISCP